jgi:serine/threonine protein kinase
MGALKTAAQRFRQYYESDLPPVASLSVHFRPDPRYPHPQQYTSLQDSRPIRFRYTAQPHDDKLIFFGKTDGGTEICIKFTQTYSQGAHLACASRGSAPMLRGFEEIPGGWFMVVMDRVDGNHSPLKESDLNDVMHGLIADAVTSLHQAGYVHGDLRPSNIVRRNDGGGFLLLDFDWAGKIGEVLYPMNVNRAPDLWRPEEARDGQYIRAEHDIAMLNNMFE